MCHDPCTHCPHGPLWTPLCVKQSYVKSRWFHFRYLSKTRKIVSIEFILDVSWTCAPHAATWSQKSWRRPEEAAERNSLAAHPPKLHSPLGWGKITIWEVKCYASQWHIQNGRTLSKWTWIFSSLTHLDFPPPKLLSPRGCRKMLVCMGWR